MGGMGGGWKCDPDVRSGILADTTTTTTTTVGGYISVPPPGHTSVTKLWLEAVAIESFASIEGYLDG